MQRRYNLARMILASVVVLSLTALMVAIDAQAQIAFQSDRDRNYEIYVMDDDGKNQRKPHQSPRYGLYTLMVALWYTDCLHV